MAQEFLHFMFGESCGPFRTGTPALEFTLLETVVEILHPFGDAGFQLMIELFEISPADHPADRVVGE